MPASYHFITNWVLEGTTCDDVYAILHDADSLPQWWPSVYLSVRRDDDGNILLWTKGWLPYTLQWAFRVTVEDPPHRLGLSANGDFVGEGMWTIAADEAHPANVKVTYDWRIEAAKPLLRRLSWLLRPVFSANHHWAMRVGLTSLKLELARRRATTDAERAAIAAPPPPTFRWLLPRRG
ncbi:MAG: SRPBCC family protein [Planctomycetota bacterium]